MGDDEARWLSSPGPIWTPYEADRLDHAHAAGNVFVVEGISDCASLIDAYQDPAVVGIPGAGGLKPGWAAAFSGLVVWCVTDNDTAGLQLRASVDQMLGPVAAGIHHVLVPEPHHDLDDWRRACPSSEVFDGELMAASTLADAQATPRGAAS